MIIAQKPLNHNTLIIIKTKAINHMPGTKISHIIIANPLNANQSRALMLKGCYMNDLKTCTEMIQMILLLGYYGSKGLN